MRYTQEDVQNINIMIGQLANYKSAVKCFLKAGESKEKLGDALFFCNDSEEKIKNTSKEMKVFNS